MMRPRASSHGQRQQHRHKNSEESDFHTTPISGILTELSILPTAGFVTYPVAKPNLISALIIWKGNVLEIRGLHHGMRAWRVLCAAAPGTTGTCSSVQREIDARASGRHRSHRAA